MIKKVTMYEAGDGTRFMYKELAERYEEHKELYAYVDEHPIFEQAGEGSIIGDDFHDWLKDNPRVFVKLLPEPVKSKVCDHEWDFGNDGNKPFNTDQKCQKCGIPFPHESPYKPHGGEVPQGYDD